MTKRKLKRDTRATSTTMAREHPLTVRVKKKNPTGKTIRDRHIRRLPETDLDEFQKFFIKWTSEIRNKLNIKMIRFALMEKRYVDVLNQEQVNRYIW